MGHAPNMPPWCPLNIKIASIYKGKSNDIGKMCLQECDVPPDFPLNQKRASICYNDISRTCLRLRKMCLRECDVLPTCLINRKRASIYHNMPYLI